jgi:hypothetical protein
MKNSLKSTDGAVARQIVDFLNSQSLQRRENASCESCGVQMQYREFQFWMAGSEMTWNIRLPVCASCAHLEAYEALAHSKAA